MLHETVMTNGKSMFHVTILSIFPEMFPGCLQYSLAGQALEKNIWSYNVVNIRDFGITRHKNVDDTSYGGGNGLIMRPDVLSDSIDYALSFIPNAVIYYMSPRGKLLNQRVVSDITMDKEIIIICGRFEGIDERVIEEYNVREISLGDFILSGGEIAAIALLDSCIRMLPGVLSNQATLEEESFSDRYGEGGLLEYPLYTKPAVWRGKKVPDVLLSGNHKVIEEWRLKQSIDITAARRPDLIKS